HAAIYTLSLHDALPIFGVVAVLGEQGSDEVVGCSGFDEGDDVGGCADIRLVDQQDSGVDRELALEQQLDRVPDVLRQRLAGLRRSEEHTSELQSLAYLV